MRAEFEIPNEFVWMTFLDVLMGRAFPNSRKRLSSLLGKARVNESNWPVGLRHGATR